MRREYAILDDLGQLFGLPVRTWPTEEAAYLTLEYLEERRMELEREAADAKDRLSGDCSDMSEQERSSLVEIVSRWHANRDRNYRVVWRDVSDWQVV